MQIVIYCECLQSHQASLQASQIEGRMSCNLIMLDEVNMLTWISAQDMLIQEHIMVGQEGEDTHAHKNTHTLQYITELKLQCICIHVPVQNCV